jgi:hypothetical protein
MLTLRQADGQYYIGHFPQHGGERLVYDFSLKQLPERTIAHIHTLPVFRATDTIYLLDKKQEEAFAAVLHKLIAEDHSHYVYGEQLKKTYLIELIHLITKTYLSGLGSPV